MIFEKKNKAIETFTKTFGGKFEKLSATDIDYKIFDSNKSPIAYTEIIVRNRTIKDAYPLPIYASRLVKLVEKRLNPVIIWSCEDGLIYGKVKDIYGEIKWGGLPPHSESNKHNELICYFSKQRCFKYIKY
jgi:hypothetical protein